MDRRSLLKMFAFAGAAVAVLHPVASEAMPVAKALPVDPVTTSNAVATDADLEAAKTEKVYWGWRRRRYWRRRVYWRPRYRYWRRRYWRPRRVYWRRPVYWRPRRVYWRPYRRVWW